MVRAVFPNEDTVFGPILPAFAPWATAIGMGSLRFSTLSPITVTVMSCIPESGSAPVMMMLRELLDCGAVERRHCIGRDLHLLQLGVVMIVGVVGVIFAPWNRPASVVGVVGVAGTPKNRLLIESRVHQIFVVQFAQIDFVPRVIGESFAFVGQSGANKSQSQDRNDEDDSRHLPSLFAGGSFLGVLFVCLSSFLF